MSAPRSGYYLSYVASPSTHSFIIVSKVENGVCEAIASFGLYGRYECYKSEIISCGLFSEPGRIRSEHFYRPYYINSKGSEATLGMRKLIGKTFTISEETMKIVTERVIYDAGINKIPNEKLASIAKDINTQKGNVLSETERCFRDDFLDYLNNNFQGGPAFNGLDFNCHKYALYILRLAGIQDPYLESFTFPPGANDLKFFTLEKLNIENQPTPVVTTSASYDNIFYAQITSSKGAIALLKDYAESPFHFKRHHKNAVRKVLKEIDKYSDIGAIIAAIEKEIPPHRYYGGSLQRRLDYLKTHSADSQEEFDAKVTEINKLKANMFEDLLTVTKLAR